MSVLSFRHRVDKASDLLKTTCYACICGAALNDSKTPMHGKEPDYLRRRRNLASMAPVARNLRCAAKHSRGPTAAPACSERLGKAMMMTSPATGPPVAFIEAT